MSSENDVGEIPVINQEADLDINTQETPETETQPSESTGRDITQDDNAVKASAEVLTPETGPNDVSETSETDPNEAEQNNDEDEEIKFDAGESSDSNKFDENIVIENDEKNEEYEKIDCQNELESYDKTKVCEYLKQLTVEELLPILDETKEINSYIAKENQIYESILIEDETIRNTLESVEMDEERDILQESFATLSFPEKCFFAGKRLEQLEKDFELKKAGYSHELQNLRFKLESLNMSLKNLKEDKEKFDKNIRIGGRHPITKKIILQKVSNYFNNSIKTKMALTNRYKIQLQSDIMERNKFLSQIDAQEKRLASLDLTEFQETQFEHKKTLRVLALCKEQLSKCKSRFSPLLQTLSEMKKSLEKEKTEMEHMKTAVSKQEHLKMIMITEKARNDQKVEELKAAMKKIKLDPRRHDLPEVIDYAAVKKENVALKQSIKKWKKNVAVAEQAQFLYLTALQKKAQ